MCPKLFPKIIFVSTNWNSDVREKIKCVLMEFIVTGLRNFELQIAFSLANYFCPYLPGQPSSQFKCLKESLPHLPRSHFEIDRSTISNVISICIPEVVIRNFSVATGSMLTTSAFLCIEISVLPCFTRKLICGTLERN